MKGQCAICKGDTHMGYILSSVPEDYTLHFCSRVCLVEFMAPEITKAVVPKQWIPTPEEEARMSE